jgi:hypothetical protein
VQEYLSRTILVQGSEGNWSVSFEDDIEPEPESETAAAAARRADRELDLREREVLAKEKEVNVSRWSSPLVVGFIAAALALVGNIGVTIFNNRSTQQIEHSHAQSNLIIEAVKTNGDTTVACKNLTFFVKLGLLEDTGKTIGQACPADYSGPPSLPAAAGGGGSSLFDTVPDIDFKVKVINEEGKPIPSAQVNLIVTSGQGCTTGEDGTCTLKISATTPLVNVDVYALGYKDSGFMGLSSPVGNRGGQVILKR